MTYIISQVVHMSVLSVEIIQLKLIHFNGDSTKISVVTVSSSVDRSCKPAFTETCWIKICEQPVEAGQCEENG